MEVLTLKSFEAGKGFWYDREEDIKELRAQGLKDTDIIVNFAYTDYGGNFIDNVFIEYFENKNSHCFKVQDTVYYGKNAILWGKEAQEVKAQSQNYILGYEDIENFYLQKENEAVDKGIIDFLGDYKKENEEVLTDEENKAVFFFLSRECFDCFSVQSGGNVDYSTDTVNLEIETFLNGAYKMILSKAREEKLDTLYYEVIK